MEKTYITQPLSRLYSDGVIEVALKIASTIGNEDIDYMVRDYYYENGLLDGIYDNDDLINEYNDTCSSIEEKYLDEETFLWEVVDNLDPREAFELGQNVELGCDYFSSDGWGSWGGLDVDMVVDHILHDYAFIQSLIPNFDDIVQCIERIKEMESNPLLGFKVDVDSYEFSRDEMNLELYTMVMDFLQANANYTLVVDKDTISLEPYK